MGVLVLEVAASGFVLGVLVFILGLLAIRLATPAAIAPQTHRQEPQALEDLVLASL